MNEEAYNIALRNTLTEIKNVCPDITWSFILTKSGVIYAEGEQGDNPARRKAAYSLQTLVEKASAVGGLDNLLIDGDEGKAHILCVDDMYVVTATSKEADIAYLHNISRVIFSSVLKIMNNIAAGPTHLKPEPSPLKERVKTPESVPAKPSKQSMPEHSQQLIVDTLKGLMVKSDTVQVDQETLKRWAALLNVKDIDEVEIESFAGKTLQCKVKSISDSNLEGRGLVRIPEKACQVLEVRRGELVRVKPILS